MQLIEKTPLVPPIPRTFDINLNDIETAGLIDQLRSIFKDVPEQAAAGAMTFCNARFFIAQGATKPTCAVQVQYAPAVEKPTPAPAAVLPASSTVLATATPAAPAKSP